MKKVLIIEAQVKKYRRSFYESLHTVLCENGIQLQVAYSHPPAAEARKQDTCDLPAEYGLKVKAYWLWPERLLYQPLLKAATTCDLVIVDQGNRFLLNHLLLPLSRMGIQRVAFWGHGENRRAERIQFSEWYRRMTLNWVAWWFAYTKGTAKYLETQGIPVTKITPVQNSIDTREIREHVKRFKPHDRTTARTRLGIPVGAPVGIFCGTLDKLKSVPFLIESSRMIKARKSDFHLIIVGGGPEQEVAERLIQGLPYVHWVGPQFGREKVEFMAASDVFLLPGAVGLAILDAFAAGLPMLTTQLETHGPEIEYLEEGVNGLKSAATIGEFADLVSSLLDRKDYLAQLQAGAQASVEKYSIDNMVTNFHAGIRSCLGLLARGAGAGVLERGLDGI